MRAQRVRGALVAAVAAITVALVPACTNPVNTPQLDQYFGVATLDAATGQWVGGYGPHCWYSMTVSWTASEVVHGVITDTDTGTVVYESDPDAKSQGQQLNAGGDCLRVDLSAPVPFTYTISFRENWA